MLRNNRLGVIKIMKLLTVKEISELLRVKTSTIYQWAEMGKIPCLKVNGSLRFLEDEILNWIRDCKMDPVGYYNALAGRRPGKEGRR
jgi:excisionase family DNA binding protein